MKKIIGVLIVIPIFFVDAKQTHKMQDVEALVKRPVAQSAPTVKATPTINVDKEVIRKRLDAQLQSPVAEAWDDRVNDLFDLAMVDRELARQYFVQMREKIAATDVKPIEVVVEKPTKVAEEKPVGLPEGEEPMRKSTMPAPKKGAPRGGPAKKNGGAAKGAAKPAASKEAPKAKGTQIFSMSKLQELDNDRLLKLFNDLLNELGTVPINWNGMAVEKVEEKTKYGSKIYNVYGTPVPDWTRKIDTLKKVLIAKNIMLEAEITQKINDRIVQVRAAKSIKPAESAKPEEKPKEELTEDELMKEIEKQLAKEALAMPDFVAIKSNIKALDKFNHAKSMEYDAQLKKRMK